MPNFQKIKYQLNIKIVKNQLQNEISDENILNDKLTNHYSQFDYHHNGDSGIDLYNDEILVESFGVRAIDFHIQCEMINLKTNEYQSYFLVPRSSLTKTSFLLANSIGVIDAGYRGNLIAKIKNFNPNKSELLSEGSYFQIISPDLKPIKINLVNELSQTTRDQDGFGSTSLIKKQINVNKYILVIDTGKIFIHQPLAPKYPKWITLILYKDDSIIWTIDLTFKSTLLDNLYDALYLGLKQANKLSIKNLIVKTKKILINEFQTYSSAIPKLKLYYY
jgi:dUTP pyrophosphatase